MKSKELIDRLVNPEEETTKLIIKDMPIAVMQAASQIVNNVLVDASFKNSSHEETLMYLFWAGYTTARHEDRIILEDTFLNKE